MRLSADWDPLLNSPPVSRALATIKSKSDKMTVVPESELIFRMFRLLDPGSVRVVIMGQDPYPTRCPLTSIPYASGVAFMPRENTKRVPRTFEELESEMRRDLGVSESLSYTLFAKWIKQGVFLTNVALTTGINCEQSNLSDHKVVWEQFSRNFIRFLSDRGGIVFCLAGSEAWNLQDEIDPDRCRVLKVHHPVSRSKDKPFSGCSMFSKINHALLSLGMSPIQWTSSR